MERFIPGIYNYCDRWCERCTFTSRCRNYEGNSKLSTEQLDINNKAFWDNISNSFKEAISLLYENAKAQGIDLDAITDAEIEEAAEGRSLLREMAKKDPSAKLCKAYQRAVMPFIKRSEGFTDKTRELVSHLHLGIKTEEDVVYTVADIGHCFEVIQWYLFFINAKLQRALLGKMDDNGWDAANGFQKDSDGSAKIALIAIDKSMAAWIKLYELLPSSEDTTLKALSLLEKLKTISIKTFPEAMQFKRPGFDAFSI